MPPPRAIPGGPSQCNWGSLASPTGRAESGQGWGLGEERRKGHTKQADLTAGTLPPASAKQPGTGDPRVGKTPLPSRSTPAPTSGRPLPPKCTRERMTRLDIAPTPSRRPPPRGGAGAWAGWALPPLTLTAHLQPHYSLELPLPYQIAAAFSSTLMRLSAWCWD